MSDSLDQVPEAAPSGFQPEPGVLAELWRNLFPWDDMNAKGPPERWLRLGTEVLPVLSVLIAQAADRPRLVQVDAVDRLLTATGLTTVQLLTAPVNLGDNVAEVDNGVPFPPGSYVMLAGSPGGGGAPASGPYRVLNGGSKAFAIVGQFPQGYAAGDYVIGLPTVTAIGDGFIDRPVDQALQQIGGGGAALALGFPGVTDTCWTLAYLDCSLRQTGAVAVVTTVQVWDGPSGTGTLLFSHQLAAPATVGSIDHLPSLKRPLRCTRGNALTVSTTGPGATGISALAAGAWQSVDRGASE